MNIYIYIENVHIYIYIYIYNILHTYTCIHTYIHSYRHVHTCAQCVRTHLSRKGPYLALQFRTIQDIFVAYLGLSEQDMGASKSQGAQYGPQTSRALIVRSTQKAPPNFGNSHKPTVVPPSLWLQLGLSKPKTLTVRPKMCTSPRVCGCA